MADDLRQELSDLRKDYSALKLWAFGNGKPEHGISTRIMVLEKAYENMNAALAKLAESEESRRANEEAIKNQLRGARIAILSFAGLFGAGGLAGWAWLASLLQRILEQIP